MDFKGFMCTIFNPISMKIAKVDMSKNSFYLKGDSTSHHALLVKIVDSHTCHFLFEHFNDNTLKLLHLTGMV